MSFPRIASVIQTQESCSWKKKPNNTWSNVLTPGCLNNPHRNWEIHRGKFLGPVGHLKRSEVLLGSSEFRAVSAHQNGFVSLQSTVVSHGVKSGSLTLKHPILFFKDSCELQICSFPSFQVIAHTSPYSYFVISSITLSYWNYPYMIIPHPLKNIILPF